MAVQQLCRAVDDLGTHGRFGEITNPEDQGAARLQASEDRRGQQVICFARFRFELRQGFKTLTHMRRSAAGQQLLLDAAAIAEQPHTIAGVESQLRQRHGRRAGIIELGVAIGVLVGDAGAQQAAGVQNNPYRLTALGLVLPRDQVPSARGGGPAEIAKIVAGAILAQALKLASQAALTHLAQLQIDAAALGQEDLLIFSGAQFRINSNRLGEWRQGPARNES